MKPILLGPHPEDLWPLLHEVSGVSRGRFRRHFEFVTSVQFTPPAAGGVVVVVGSRALGLSSPPLVREMNDGVTWVMVPNPNHVGWTKWYAEPAHRLAVGLLLEEMLCR